jgi:hypothetical protein
MRISIDYLPEPELIFDNGRRGIEPRLSLVRDGEVRDRITLGLVGPRSDVDAVHRWLDRLGRFHTAKEGNAGRYRDWPGSQRALGVEFVVEPNFIRVLDDATVSGALARARRGTGFEDLLAMFSERISGLFRDTGPQCVIVCIPNELGDLRVENPGLSATERRALERLQAEEEDEQLSLFTPTPEELKAAADLRIQAEELLFRTFYRALKARTMMLPNAVPLQVIRRETVERGEDKGHSHATRAWNLAVSLYYKARQMPWRPADMPSNTCFVGISFHHLKRRAGSLIYASLAQAISSDVEPFALSGATIDHDQRRDRRPYLKADQAKGLVERVIKEYTAVAGVEPDRLVLHKTSTYQPEEVEGFLSAAHGKVPSCDLIWIRPTPFRLVRKGYEEPWRGTFCVVGDDAYLFTSGFVPWWNEYPGPHIPAPIQMGSATETDLRQRAIEILALSKINWNSSEGISRYPVTLSFAKKVGEVMVELADTDEPNPSFRFYM